MYFYLLHLYQTVLVFYTLLKTVDVLTHLKLNIQEKNLKYVLKENVQHKIYFYLPGSGSWVTPDAQIFWFGHPWHADTWPADELSVPGQSKNL